MATDCEARTTVLACETRAAAHTITFDDHENNEDSAEPLRFLSLPVEIRLQIYRYLAPNFPTSPFRDDSKPCCPSILRTNRTVYEEAMVEWYTFMPYKVSIASKQLRLYSLNIAISPGEPLPWMFHSIKTMHLGIKLEKVYVEGIKSTMATPSRHIENYQFMHACFPPHPTKTSNLQRLHVELSVTLPFFGAYREPDHLRTSLEGNLSALRSLHGLAEASIIIKLAPSLIQIYGLKDPTAPLFPWKLKFLAILRAFADDLEESMTE